MNIYELANSSEFTIERPGGSYSYTLVVSECTTETGAILAARAQAPAIVVLDSRFWKFTRFSAKLSGANDVWFVKIEYVPVDDDEDKENFAWKVRWDTSGATQHLKFGKAQAAYGLKNFPAPDIGGALNYDGKEVAGVDVPIAALKFVFTVYYPATVANPAFLKELARKTPRMNDKPWFGFDRGELLFLGGSGEYDDTKPKDMSRRAPIPVTLEFDASENLRDLKFVNAALAADNVLTVPEKLGWDHLGLRFMDFVAPGGKGYLCPFPVHAYVTRVHDFVDFAHFFQFDPVPNT